MKNPIFLILMATMLSTPVWGEAPTDDRKADAAYTPPAYLSGSMPVYPAEARLQGIEGVVMLEFLVDEQGRVIGAEAVGESHPLLAEAAQQAVANWHFAPATVDGHPTYQVVRVPIQFNLIDRIPSTYVAMD